MWLLLQGLSLVCFLIDANSVHQYSCSSFVSVHSLHISELEHSSLYELQFVFLNAFVKELYCLAPVNLSVGIAKHLQSSSKHRCL